jgi:manganese peroxidase
MSMPVAAAALVRRVTCPGGNAVSNKKCCDLFPVLEDIQKNLFDNGECGEDAHSALRIAFHDAIGYSKSKNAYVAFIPAHSENNVAFKSAAEEPMVPSSLSPTKKPLILPTVGLMTSSRARSRLLRDTTSQLVTCEFYNSLREARPSPRTTDFSIQFAAAVGVSNCPGAPRLEFLLGRPKATRPADDLTVPEPFRKLV